MALGSRVVSEQMSLIIENPTIQLFTSSELLEELTETLAKPRLQKYLTRERTKHLFDLIWIKTKLQHVSINLQLCRDPKDNFIINLATEANTTHIITGDNDLLVLNPIDQIQVLTITDFLRLLHP